MSTIELAWYRSLYWRVGLGYVAFLGLLLVAQTLLFVWLTGATAGAFPAPSNARLADLVASDIRDQLEDDPGVDLETHIQREYSRVIQTFVVVTADGRAFSNRPVPPALVQNMRARVAALTRGRAAGPRRQLRVAVGGRAEAAVIVNGTVAALVGVPPGRAAPMAALRSLGPTLALWSGGLLVGGAVAAALLIFGPVRRRLRHLEDAAARIGAGDVAARAPEDGGDEVAALARSFNRMAADLQARAAALTASDQARRQLLADVSHEPTCRTS
jgi:HAMP domain-containing protein